MNSEPIAEQKPVASKPRDWRMFITGVAVAWLIPLAVAYQYGPRSHTTYEDPLTGRIKEESTWLGMITSTLTEEDPVTEWADLNSIPGVYPGQYGWRSIDFSESWWFSRGMRGCGFVYKIPNRIFHGGIVIEGLTREQTFERYQTECVDAYREHGSIMRVPERWSAREKPLE